MRLSRSSPRGPNRLGEGADVAMLDTTALIDLSRRPGNRSRDQLASLLARLLQANDTLFTSRINEAEFRVGCYRAKEPARETETVELVLSRLSILEFDASASLVYARIQAHLFDIGKPAGDADVFIAAVALANGQRLVTRNSDHFSLIPGLMVESY